MIKSGSQVEDVHTKIIIALPPHLLIVCLFCQKNIVWKGLLVDFARDHEETFGRDLADFKEKITKCHRCELYPYQPETIILGSSCRFRAHLSWSPQYFHSACPHCDFSGFCYVIDSVPTYEGEHPQTRVASSWHGIASKSTGRWGCGGAAAGGIFGSLPKRLLMDGEVATSASSSSASSSSTCARGRNRATPKTTGQKDNSSWAALQARVYSSLVPSVNALRYHGEVSVDVTKMSTTISRQSQLRRVQKRLTWSPL